MTSSGIRPGAAEARAFCTTHWSVILSAREPGSSAARGAIAELYEQYRYPLYAYIRRKGYNHHDAQDLTQDFFAQLIDRKSLEAVSRDKGRFRTFLLACADNCLGNHRQKISAAKRGGKYDFVSWDEESADERYAMESSAHLAAEKAYDRRWALTVLEAAMTKLKDEYCRAGKSELFEVLNIFLSGAKTPPSYAETGARLAMQEPAVRTAVSRMRRRFGKCIRAELAHTVAEPRQIDEELRYLTSVLSE